MSDAELRKLQELKRLKEEKKLKKKEKKDDDMGPLPQLKADSLPPVMMNRKGGFDMIPDFLNKQVTKDLNALKEVDYMAEASKKQEEDNSK